MDGQTHAHPDRQTNCQTAEHTQGHIHRQYVFPPTIWTIRYNTHWPPLLQLCYTTFCRCVSAFYLNSSEVSEGPTITISEVSFF